MLRLRNTLALSILAVSNASGNVIGTDAQNFNPITSGLDFVTVQSSETLKPGYFNIGLFLNYAVNSLPYYDGNPQSNRSTFTNTLTSADFNLGVGLLNNWDVGVSLPHLLQQTVSDDTGTRGQFSASGNTEVRFNTKVRLTGNDAGGVAVIGTLNLNRIRNNPYTGTDAGPTYNLEVAMDRTWNKIATGLNLGHRWRSPGTTDPTIPVQPFRNQFIASVAASYLLNGLDTKLIGEIFGSLPTQRVNAAADRSQSSLELLLGLKHDFSTEIAWHVGAGTELYQGAASPDWRVYTGLNWSFGPLFGTESKTAVLERILEEDTTPEAPPAPERYIARNINFEFGSDRMDGDFSPVFEDLVKHLNKPPGFKSLVIEGHTDSVGSEQYNLTLSQRRAQAIKDHLVTKYNVPAAKIQAVGFGESLPIADNGNYQGRRANRRVEFKIMRP